MSNLKIALVYDRVNKIGGAERILTALHEIWPEAPLYTSVYDSLGTPWAKEFQIRTSFLQKIPFFRKHHEFIPFLMPIAFESFNFDEFDIVISITSAEAKGIITKPKTLHLCYCLTPTRYLWSEQKTYLDSLNRGSFKKLKVFFAEKILNHLKNWDQIASFRPDYYLSISNEVSKRIKQYYHQNSTTIYPPIDTEKFILGINHQIEPYYLIISRLVPYKRIDLAIKVFNILNKKLIIIGIGSEEKYLKQIANNNIQFITKNLTDEEIISYYQNCLSLIFPGVEDFGLTPVEVMSCGKPVIAFKEGGVLESVLEGKTGEFFSPQTPDALLKILEKFQPEKYTVENCRQQALKFDKLLFKNLFSETVYNLFDKYRLESS